VKNIRKPLAVLAVIAVGMVLTAAGCSESKTSSSARNESNVAATQLDQFLKAQPVPMFNWSQLRQNLIEIETAQANTTATTSFMFLQSGAGATGPLVHWCPSIGFPIPATYQLTAPEGAAYRQNYDDLVLPQLESTGVYTGDTTGTYVMCVGADGKAFAFYHEGFVSTVTGPAHWDTAKGEIVMDGSSSATFTAAGKK
jgi:hypothetical protein